MTSTVNARLKLVTTLEDALEVKRWAGSQRYLAVDTETTGYHPDRDRTRLLQIGWTDVGYALSVEMRGWGALAYEILSMHKGEFVAHHAKFDAAMIRQDVGFRFPLHRTHDTMLMHHTLYPHERSALKAAATRLIDKHAAYGDHQLKQDFQRYGWTWATVPIDWPTYWQYSCLDPVWTAHLFEYLHPRVMAEAPLAYDLECAVAWLTEKVERRGAMVDRSYTQGELGRFATHMSEVHALIGDTYGIEPGSSSGIIRVLQESGHEFTATTPGGGIKLDKEVLAHIDHPLVALLLDYRSHQKLSSTYLSNFLGLTSDDHPFLHPSINSIGFNEDSADGYGVKTSRMSMSDPNLQNLPKANKSKPNAPGQVVRKCIVSRPGHTLVFCDFSQIEMRLLAHYSGDDALIAAFKEEGDFFVKLARIMFNDESINESDQRRQTMKSCVPLTTEILTRRGWLTYDQVRIGDETLGYDATTKKTAWTRVNRVHVYPEADLITFGNKDRSVVCTPNHRWVSTSRYGTTQMRETRDICRSDWVVTTAAVYEPKSSRLTPQEAAIIGWVLTDGHIRRSKYTGSTSQAGGARVGCLMAITQVKKQGRESIEKLLVDIPHMLYNTEYRFTAPYARTLLAKAEIHDKGNYDPWDLALSLNTEARNAMLNAFVEADGSVQGTRYPVVSEASGSLAAELYRALVFLSGGHPSTHVRQNAGKGWQKNPIDVIRMCKQTFTGQRADMTPHSTAPVWCVSTELGTWTMRQDLKPMLTGNSMYSQAYGSGIAKFSQTAGISIQEGAAFLQMLADSFPGTKKFNSTVMAEGIANKRRTGTAFTRSDISNRPYTVASGQEYALVNRRLQGAAAEIFKIKLLELQAAGLDQYMVLFVHDEVILDVPDEEVRDVITILNEVMNDDTLLKVPLTAEVSYGQRWGEKYAWKD